MDKPALVILAAGMGSRFGGLKQIAPMDERGHAIIDFSLFDAYRAGFRKVVFIIKHEIEEDFKAAVGHRMEKYFDVRYAFQQLDMLPEGYTLPEGRVKPWGTGHATLCAAAEVNGPFVVINADDFYGPTAYQAIYDYLDGEHPANEHAIVAYLLRNTVTEHGTVARGVCRVEDGFLADVTERTKIAKRGNNAAYTEDGETWVELPGSSPVSMNFWGFQPSMMEALKERFPAWLDENLPKNPERCEYFLPFVVDSLIKEGEAQVRVLNCRETWHGVTYREDVADVVAYIAKLRSEGVYPESLLD